MAARRTALLGAVITALSLFAAVLTAPPATAATGRTSTAWIPYWNIDAAYRSVMANADLFHTASPFWYDASSCTSIVGYPGAGNTTIINGLRSRGMRVIPTITAKGLRPAAAISCFSDPSSRAAAVARVVAVSRSRAYDGIDFDYEHLALTTDAAVAGRVREAFNAFASDACTALRAIRKTCVLTVMPRTSDASTVWRGKLIPAVYDYRHLGRVADRVRVMAYDQHAGRYGPGPMAGLPWVKAIASYTRATVARSKVELGIPLYGRDFAAGASRTVLAKDARALARRHGAVVRWSDTHKERYFRYTSRGVRHTVWFSDWRAVGWRVNLARSYGFAGQAFWAAGQQDSRTWATVRDRT